jgi:hypothetical protein
MVAGVSARKFGVLIHVEWQIAWLGERNHSLHKLFILSIKVASIKGSCSAVFGQLQCLVFELSCKSSGKTGLHLLCPASTPSLSTSLLSFYTQCGDHCPESLFIPTWC